MVFKKILVLGGILITFNANAQENVMVDLSVLDELDNSDAISSYQPLFPIVKHRNTIKYTSSKPVKKSPKFVAKKQQNTSKAIIDVKVVENNATTKDIESITAQEVTTSSKSLAQEPQIQKTLPQTSETIVKPVAPKVEFPVVEPTLVAPKTEVVKEQAPLAPKAEVVKEKSAPLVAPKTEAVKEQASLAPKTEVIKEKSAPLVAPKTEAVKEQASLAPKSEVVKEKSAPLVAPKTEAVKEQALEPIVKPTQPILLSVENPSKPDSIDNKNALLIDSQAQPSAQAVSSVIKFSENISDLNSKQTQQIDNIIASFKDPANNKIAIYSYNLDNGVDTFKRKRLSLNRAIAVRSYLLQQKYKNFSIKVINIDSNSDKINTIELQEL